jgi:hypothetical protein
MTDSVQTVFLESIVMTLFAIAAVVGFRSSAWIVVAALAAHGLLDAVHGCMLDNSRFPCGGRRFVSPTTSGQPAASRG